MILAWSVRGACRLRGEGCWLAEVGQFCCAVSDSSDDDGASWGAQSCLSCHHFPLPRFQGAARHRSPPQPVIDGQCFEMGPALPHQTNSRAARREERRASVLHTVCARKLLNRTRHRHLQVPQARDSTRPPAPSLLSMLTTAL